MRTYPLPPVEFLVECFDYDGHTGELRWRERPAHHFPDDAHCRSWNARWAGEPALSGIDADGYLRGEAIYEGRRVRLRASRVIWKMETGDDTCIVDHANGKRTDNRLKNLRAATPAQNSRNRGSNKGKWLPKCVFASKGGYEAKVNRGGKRVYLGFYRTPDAAARAVRAFTKVHDGAFYHAGEPDLRAFG